MLERALTASTSSSIEIAKELGLDGVPFEYTQPGAKRLDTPGIPEQGP
jgi:hypothetical protein